MSDQSNIGKGFLKDKLGDYQVFPPESVWSSIAASLGGGNRRRMYVLLLAAAASIALAITLGINFFGTEHLEEKALAEDTQGQQEILKSPDDMVPEGPVDQASREGLSLRDKVNEAMTSLSREEAPVEDSKSKLALLEQEVEVEPDPDNELVVQLEVIQDQESRVVHEADQATDLDLATKDPGGDSLPVLTLDPGDELPLDMEPVLETDQKKDPRWMLGAVMSPMYSFRDANGQAMAGGAEYETGLVSYAGGINVSSRGNSRLAIESGIHFSRMGIAIGAPGIQLFNKSYDYANLQDASNSPELIAITNSIGNIVTESGDVIVNGYLLNARYGEAAISNPEVGDFVQVAEYGIEQHLEYLEVPFNLRYTVVDRNFELQLVGGLSTNFLVNNSVTMETASGETDIGYLTNIRNVNYSGNAGIGMIYHIHRRFSFLLEPRFRYFLNSVNDQSLPATRPYALGIYTGINYTF